MPYKKLKSWAKVNLSINVLKRLKNNYHSIESLITFINIYDEIKIKKINKKNNNVSFSGKFSNGINKKNTITTLLNLLKKKNLISKEKFEIKVKKNIPQKSGLGGGSMNAASILKYFIKENILNITKKKAEQLSYKVGSDVILGLERKNTILFKNGKIGRLKKKLNYHILIAMPNFGCSSKKIYKKFNGFSKSLYFKTNKQLFKLRNLIKSKNDLENVVFKKYLKVKSLKDFLSNLPEVLFVRMTGSGSAIVAYFRTKNSAEKAVKIFKKKYRSYWCISSKTI